MSDRTRADLFPSDAAEAFSAFVLDWLADFGCLVDALVTLRVADGASDAWAALLSVPDVAGLRESWELWEDWAGIDRSEADRRLAPHLTVEGLGRLRYALWGLGSGGDS